MVDPLQALVGIPVLLIAVGGLLYVFYSRTNAIEKTGYGSLIMLAAISIMIPLFWITDANGQTSYASQQHITAVQRGVQLYAQYCIGCYTIDKDGKLVNPTYNGYTINALNNMSDDELTRVIDAGIYNPNATQPTNPNLIPRSQQYGGPLATNDVEYLFQFIRSASPQYLKKHGFTGDSAINGFTLLVSYLQTNLPSVYQTASAPPPSNPNQFGTPVDMTNTNAVTITIVQLPPAGAACTPNCFEPLNVKVKVGTVITWVNKSTVGHTVTAIFGTNTNAPKADPQIFDSGVANIIQPGASFQYKVTMDAYNLNPDHTVYYYCQVHPSMVAELTIVQ